MNGGFAGKFSRSFLIFSAFVIISIFCLLQVSAGSRGSAVADDNVTVYQCGTITQPGVYVMNHSLEGAAVVPPDSNGCIQITADDVTLDCAGFYVRNTTLQTNGIFANSVNDNLTIRNCNITMNDSGSGFGMALGVVNSLIINNTLGSNARGIYLSGTRNTNITNNAINASGPAGWGISIEGASTYSNTITKNTIVSGSWGVDMASSSNNNIVLNNTLLWNSIGVQANTNAYNNTIADNNISFGSTGIRIALSGNNTVLNNAIYSNSYGIYVDTDAGGNNVTNNIIWNSTIDGIYLTSAKNDTVSGGKINSSAAYGVRAGAGTNNTLIRDLQIMNSGQNDTYLAESSINNTFLNVSYNGSKEEVDASSQLIRQWYVYLDVKNSADGFYLQSVNVSDYNSSGSLFWSQVIPLSRSLFSLTEYANNGTSKNYFGNHYVNVTKPGFAQNSTIVNLTQTQPNIDFEYLTMRDIQGPYVNLTAPSHGSSYFGGSYVLNFTFNVTDDTAITNCTAYTNGTGHANTSAIVENADNFINFSLSRANYTSYVNCTDLAGNTGNSSTVNFTIAKYTPILMTYIDGIPGNKTVVYPTSVVVKGNSTASLPSFSFTLNVYNVSNTSQYVQNSSNPATLTPGFGAGTYQVEYYTPGNGDWNPAVNQTLFLMITQNSSNPVTLAINNGTAYYNQNVTISNGTSVAVACSNVYANSGSCYLYRDGSLASNSTNETVTLANGTYAYKANTTGNANYSENFTGGTFYLIVNILSDGSACASSSECSGGYCVHGTCRNSSTYCGDTFCDSGESCTADNSACSTGYACTNGCVSTGSVQPPSGGGPSGGGVIQQPTNATTISLAKGNVNITIPFIGAGKTANVSIAKTEDVAFRQINISVSSNVNNIKMVIRKMAGLSASLSHDISGRAYHYIQIDKTNLTDTSVSRVYVKFAINKTWLEANGISSSRMSFYGWSDDGWNELPTAYLNEDAYETFYRAESPAVFSHFVIGTRGGEAAVVPIASTACAENWSCSEWSPMPCAGGNQTRVCTDSDHCGTTYIKPNESRNCAMEAKTPEIANWIYLAAAIIIVAVIAAIFAFRKKIIRSSPAK